MSFGAQEDQGMSDEFHLDSPKVRHLIEQVKAALGSAAPGTALQQLRSVFAELLADSDWLPASYRQPVRAGGMGGGIASWLLYRAGDGSLSLFSLVVPPGSATPVHDHLAWGLVGLYEGEQDEEVFRRLPGEDESSSAPLELVARNHLRPGDFYVLEPPEGDIHRVLTTSVGPSVSIHLLGNDTGCTWRHVYTPEDGGVRPFRSGWSNVPCKDEDTTQGANGPPHDGQPG
jgi:predicted metal-dependent enzyme (double-stranded beta helix superfamily)